MKVINVNEKFLISLTLADGETGKGVKAFIYDNTGANVTPIPFIVLSHVANGTYMNTSADLFMPIGSYIVQVIVFSDNTYATIDADYGTSADDFVVEGEITDLASLATAVTGIATNLTTLSNNFDNALGSFRGTDLDVEIVSVQ